MVLLSGNNKSVSQQTNDERSKAQGVTAIHNSQGNKSTDGGRIQSSFDTSMNKGMTIMDEFKYGFPSQGLSTTSNKWWGSSDHDDSAGTNGSRAECKLEESAAGEAEKVAYETGNAGSSEIPQGAALLMTVRKRAAEEGREALKLGVFQRNGVNKLGKREKTLLRRIFRSSLPSSWIPDL
ncbi:uncharacterized protein LOC107495523 [Arachis duranensis]|uniref:Uncharacterized protein LOC107495523 n=1 Tax=Arachis duranensis TaxID=130453 RepID=A0A6P4DQ74_ARADU|nr:uncharacterized protein LOC107495523 [Arachis duranensis]